MKNNWMPIFLPKQFKNSSFRPAGMDRDKFGLVPEALQNEAKRLRLFVSRRVPLAGKIEPNFSDKRRLLCQLLKSGKLPVVVQFSIQGMQAQSETRFFESPYVRPGREKSGWEVGHTNYENPFGLSFKNGSEGIRIKVDVAMCIKHASRH